MSRLLLLARYVEGGAPTVSHATPSDGTTAVGDPTGTHAGVMTIHGTGFVSGATVLVGGVAATDVALVDGTITCKPPAVPIPAAPNYDGVDDKLVQSSGLFGQFIGATPSAYTFFAVIDLRSLGPADATWHREPALFQDSGGTFGLVVSVLGARLTHREESLTYRTTDRVPVPRGFVVIQCRYTGSAIEVRCNGGSWVTLAVTGMNASVASTSMRLGASYDATKVIDGTYLEAMWMDSSANDTTCDDFIRYVNKTYGQDIGGLGVGDFDPTTLSATGYWRAGTYASGTWTGVASAGASGSRTMTEATNPPAVSTAPIARLHDIVVTNPDTLSATLARGYRAWHPGLESDCTFFAEKGDYSIVGGTVGTWVARTGSNVESTTLWARDKPAAVSGEPSFQSDNGLLLLAQQTLFAQAAGAFVCTVIPETQHNSEEAGVPYSAPAIMSKLSSGPVGLFNFAVGASAGFIAFCYDVTAGVYRSAVAYVAGSTTIGNVYDVAFSYVQASHIRSSVDGSSFASASAPLTGHNFHAPADGLRLGVRYDNGLVWRGRIRAVATFNAAKDDAFAQRYRAWRIIRHGAAA